MTRSKPLSEVKPLYVYVIVDITTGLPRTEFFWSRPAARDHMRSLLGTYRIRRAKVYVYNK